MRRTRQDGLVNVMTGMGDDEVDLQMHTTRQPSYQRSTAEYRAEWRDNAMANREVSQVAGDIFREGFDLVGVKPEGIDLSSVRSWIEGDVTPRPDGSIDRTHGLLYYAQKVIETGDKVGGAALYPILDDGLDPSKPLDWRRIHRIVAWEVLDRDELIPFVTSGMGTEPEYWMLADVIGASGRDGKLEPLRPGQVIHKSRLWIHKGVELDRREERMRQWWGGSVLDMLWDVRRAVESGVKYANTYLHRCSWLHYSFAELNEIYTQKEEETGRDIGVELVDERMRQFRRIASTMGIALSDGGKQGSKAADGATELAGRNPDKVESVVERTGDLVPIVQLNLDQWQSGFGAPPSIAFGDQSSALRGGKNEGDWQSWQGTIDHKRATKNVTGLVTWMLNIIFACHTGPTHGLMPTQWQTRWRPLIVPTPLEEAATAKAQADADNARIEKGVAKPEEVRQQRLVQGDTTGPLRAAPDQPTNTQTGTVQSTDVQAQALNGAQMDAIREITATVAAGDLDPEVAEWLLSVAIPGVDLTEAKKAMAKASVWVRPGSSGAPTEDIPKKSGGGGSSVSAATLMSAGSLIAQGKLAPEFLSAVVQHEDPENYPPEVAAMLTAAALGEGPALAPQAPVAVAPTADAELPTDPADPSPAEAGRMPEPEEPDPLDVLLAAIPDDLMTPEALVELIKKRTGLDVTTQRIHALAKRFGARSGRVGNAMGFSARDIKLALARDNGLEMPAPATAPAEIVAAAQVDAFKHEHSGRQRNPDDFVASTFRRIRITDGIDAIVGKLKRKPEGGMVVQTYRFNTEKFTEAAARTWLDDHDLNVGQFEAAAAPSA